MSELEIHGKGIKFDATINLGHIITFIGFLLTGFAAWQSMDKRVVILEETRKYQELRDENQDAAAQASQRQLADSLGDIKKSLDKVSDKLDRRSGV